MNEYGTSYTDVNKEIQNMLSIKRNIPSYTEPQADILPLLETLNRTYSEINMALKTQNAEHLKDVILKSDIKMNLVCETLLETLKKTTQDKTDLINERSELNKQLNDIKTKEATVKIQLNKVETELEYKKRNLEEVNRLINDQKDRMNEFKMEVAKSRSEVVFFKTKINELENLKQKGVDRMVLFEKECEALGSIIREKEEEVKRLSNEKKEEEDKNGSIKTRMAELESLVDVLNKKNDSVNKTLSLCNAELSKLLCENKKLKAENDKFKESSYYYEGLYNSLNSQNSYLNTQLNKMLRTSEINKDVDGFIKESTKRKNKYKKRYLKLKNQINECTIHKDETNDSLISQIEKLENKNKEYLEKLKKIENEKREIENRVKEYKNNRNQDKQFIDYKKDRERKIIDNEIPGTKLYSKFDDRQFETIGDSTIESDKKDTKDRFGDMNFANNYESKEKGFEDRGINKHLASHWRSNGGTDSHFNSRGNDEWRNRNQRNPVKQEDFHNNGTYKYDIFNKNMNQTNANLKLDNLDPKLWLNHEREVKSFQPDLNNPKNHENLFEFNTISGNYPKTSYNPTNYQPKSEGVYKPGYTAVPSQNNTYMKLFNLENTYEDKKEDAMLGGFINGFDSGMNLNKVESLPKSNLNLDYNIDKNIPLNNNSPVVLKEEGSVDSIKTYHTSSTLKEMMARTDKLQAKFQNLEEKLDHINEGDTVEKIKDRLKTYNTYYSDFNIESNESDVI